MKKATKAIMVGMLLLIIIVVAICCNGKNRINSKYIHSNGSTLVNKENTPFLIKSIGFYDALDMDIYSDNSDEYAYLENYASEDSYAEIAYMGFNTVTLYINYKNFYKDETMEEYNDGWMYDYIDQNIKWAEKCNIKIVLDMRVVPDEIWSNPETQKKYTDLLKKIANKYKKETTLIGYNVLNTELAIGNDKFSKEENIYSIYELAIEKIRSEDKNHVIFIEDAYTLYKNGFIFKDINWAYALDFYYLENYTMQKVIENTNVNNVISQYPYNNIILFNGKYIENEVAEGNYFTGNSNGWIKIENTVDNGNNNTGSWQILLKNGTNNSNIFIKNISVEEYNSEGVYLSTICIYSFDEERINEIVVNDLSNGETGSEQFVGYDEEKMALRISGKYEAINIELKNRDFFPMKEGYTYKICANVNITDGEENQMLSPTLVLGNTDCVSCFNKEYLEFYVRKQAEEAEVLDVPTIVSNFGINVDTLNGKGGVDWMKDTLELFDIYDVNFNFNNYFGEEDGFSMYNQVSDSKPALEYRNEELYNVLADNVPFIKNEIDNDQSMNIDYLISYYNGKTSVNFFEENDSDYKEGYIYTYEVDGKQEIGCEFSVYSSQKVKIKIKKYGFSKEITLYLQVVNAPKPMFSIVDEKDKAMISYDGCNLTNDNTDEMYYSINGSEYKKWNNHSIFIYEAGEYDFSAYYVTKSYGIKSDIYNIKFRTGYGSEDANLIIIDNTINNSNENTEIIENSTETYFEEDLDNNDEYTLEDSINEVEEKNKNNQLDDTPYMGDEFLKKSNIIEYFKYSFSQ